jgi:phosphoribosylglycinamide formyltransferase-1
MKLAIFISGRGSNMKSIVQACENGTCPAEVVLVLSNNPQAQGLVFARSKGIQTCVVNHKDFKTKEAFEESILDAIDGIDIDIICLAGFMRILSAHFIDLCPCDSIINIHPSLLPAYKGLNTHQRALDDGKKETGCSVHFVTAELDAGDVIVQKTVPVKDGDTAEKLALRVLEQEHKAYPEAISLLAKRAHIDSPHIDSHCK